MKAHRELLALHRAINNAHRDVIQYKFNTLGANWCPPTVGASLLIISALTAVHLPGAATLAIAAAGIITLLATPFIINHVKRRKATLASNYRNAIANYLTSLHSVLDANGYSGEYISENDPASGEYRCIALKDGDIETVTVKVCHDGMVFSSKNKMLAPA